LPIEDWRWTLEVDLFGVIHGCHVFVPRLRAQGSGHILNVASAAGIVSPPRMAAYNVAKAGVIALSETLAAELEGSTIGVTVLCPTFFQTNIAAHGRFVDERFRELGKRLVERGPKADRIARAAIESVERGELYALPMAEARWLWTVKRFAPRAFSKIFAWISNRRS
jgi:short-subunit dehydrogenase